MLPVKKDALVISKMLLRNFQEIRKILTMEQLLKKNLQSFQKLGCNKSLKTHVLHSYLEDFSGNLDEISEEQGQRFHQDIKCVDKRHQRCWNVNMLA